ncbi:MAG: SDR family oxidoreductase [Mesorhizobium sp.]|nr:MAG: SDR family oxidoreductase [Mesorhizobium sp.]
MSLAQDCWPGGNSASGGGEGSDYQRIEHLRPQGLSTTPPARWLERLTRCWALELAPQGVRVNAVTAGPT